MVEFKIMEETIKQLQEIAKNNNFYLCPLSVWDKVTGVIGYKDQEIRRIKKERQNWKNKYNKLKSQTHGKVKE